MLFQKKKSDGAFYPAKLERNPVDFPNPCRGWYRIYTFCPQEQREEELVWLPMEETETLALVRLDIGAFRQREIDAGTLGFVEKIFERFMQAGKDMILRILYDTEGKGMEKEPPFLDMVLTHMRQLGRLVAGYADGIYLTQGLFVGNWGEMHGSKFLSPENVRVLEQTWRSATGGKVPVAFRKLSFCRMVSGKKSPRPIGLYDDAILASETHMGTFAEKTVETTDGKDWEQDWSKEEELSYLERTAPYLPVGGEVVSPMYRTAAGQKQSLGALSPQEAEDTLRELQSMRISYLNCIYDSRLLEQWKQTKVAADGGINLYEYIGARLGYRFFVEKAEWIRGKRPYLQIQIRNEGFARLTKQAVLKVEVRAAQHTLKTIPLEFDLRTLKPEGTEILSVSFPEDMPEGEVWLCMTLKRGKKAVRFADKGAGDGLYLGRWEK